MYEVEVTRGLHDVRNGPAEQKNVLVDDPEEFKKLHAIIALAGRLGDAKRKRKGKGDAAGGVYPG